MTNFEHIQRIVACNITCKTYLMTWQKTSRNDSSDTFDEVSKVIAHLIVVL